MARPVSPARVVVALVAVLSASAVLAHDAPQGWTYDPDCCGGDTSGLTSRGDCAPVPDAAILEVPGGYRVRLAPGDHFSLRLWPHPVDEFVPHGSARIRVSGDGRKHACVSTIGGVYCIYLPPGGV